MIIYWTTNFKPSPDRGMVIEKPVAAKINLEITKLQDKFDMKNAYNKCPAYQDFIKNLYAVKIPFSYDLNYENGILKSSHYNQQFFDEYVSIRDIETRLFSFKHFYYFLPESNDLFFSQLAPQFEITEFAKKTVLIPGTFNIGKWPRPIDCAFYMTDNKIQINKDDILYYIKFHTKEKIIFKRFFITEKYQKLIQFIANSNKNSFFKSNPLTYYYNLMYLYPKYKNLLLKEVKQNLLE